MPVHLYIHKINVPLLIAAVPEDFDYNPHSGKHGDRSHRVELRRSSIEYIAPSEYMVRPSNSAAYF